MAMEMALKLRSEKSPYFEKVKGSKPKQRPLRRWWNFMTSPLSTSMARNRSGKGDEEFYDDEDASVLSADWRSDPRRTRRRMSREASPGRSSSIASDAFSDYRSHIASQRGFGAASSPRSTSRGAPEEWRRGAGGRRDYTDRSVPVHPHTMRRQDSSSTMNTEFLGSSWSSDSRASSVQSVSRQSSFRATQRRMTGRSQQRFDAQTGGRPNRPEVSRASERLW